MTTLLTSNRLTYQSAQTSDLLGGLITLRMNDNLEFVKLRHMMKTHPFSTMTFAAQLNRL